MFAIFEDGSRQYKVQVGDKLSLDYREDASPGDTLNFDRLLLANDGDSSAIGRPLIDGAVVETAVQGLLKGKKLEITKFRRRKNSRRHTGHRQKYTAVTVTAINVPGLDFSAPPPEQPAAEPEPEPAAATPDTNEATAAAEE